MMNQAPKDGDHVGNARSSADHDHELDVKLSADDKWDVMYQKLARYYEVHGHSNVPSRYPDDPALGFWVSTQRRQFRKAMEGPHSHHSSLHPERKRKLDSLQFQFSAKDPNSMSWEARFKQLKEFVKKYGHALVPIKWKENSQLASWVSRQRQEYRQRVKGLPSRLTDERLALLAQVGFVWEPKRGAPRREEQLKEVASAPTRVSSPLAQEDQSPRTPSTATRAFILNNAPASAVALERNPSPSAIDALMVRLGERRSSREGSALSPSSATIQEDTQRGQLPTPRPVVLQQEESLLLAARQNLSGLRAMETPLGDRLLQAALNDRISHLAAQELRFGESNILGLGDLRTLRANRLSVTSSYLNPGPRGSFLSPSSGSATSSIPTSARTALAMSNVGALRSTSTPLSGRASLSGLPTSLAALPVGRLPALPTLCATNVASLPSSNRAPTRRSWLSAASQLASLPPSRQDMGLPTASTTSNQLGALPPATSQELALLQRIRERNANPNPRNPPTGSPRPPFF